MGDTNTRAADSVVDWSEDEQRELDRIVGEIDAEDAQDEPKEGSDKRKDFVEDSEDGQD